MLELKRNVNERLRIAEDIIITIVAINGKQVQVGIDAPRSVAVRRQETVERAGYGQAPAAESGREGLDAFT